eukprot:GHVT01054544.1.p2 GENE.GHVT01054544.1~~GHVT01054544.1.p2  ORF type:complete len:183 (-),score=21.26 GHVT01054544.1:2427-2975(-)
MLALEGEPCILALEHEQSVRVGPFRVAANLAEGLDFFSRQEVLTFREWSAKSINATDAWKVTTSCKEIGPIALFDAGIDYHVDLEAATWTNPDEDCTNNIDDDGNGYVDDCHGYDFVNDTPNPVQNTTLVGESTLRAALIGAAGNDTSYSGNKPASASASLSSEQTGGFDRLVTHHTGNSNI